MHQYTVLTVVVGIVAILLSTSTLTVGVPMIASCQPNALSDAPPKIRQLCYALEQVLVENPSRESVDVLDTQLFDRGAKRQDVDHVFLRFGRRMGY